MEQRVAIVTGASGGIGRQFTRLLLQEEIDEIWAVARNQKKLNELREKFGDKVVPIPMDLARTGELDSIGMRLAEQKPVVMYLINNAGMAKMGSYEDFTAEEIEGTIHINCSAIAVLCTLCIPYMQRGSRILNVSSASAFQPLPYLNLYASTKAFARSYSRSLHQELRKTGITVTAVCPGWVDTELLMREIHGKRVSFPGIVSAQQVAETALRDAKRGKDMSVCSLYVKYEHVFAKLFPQKLSMYMWLCGIRKYGF